MFVLEDPGGNPGPGLKIPGALLPSPPCPRLWAGAAEPVGPSLPLPDTQSERNRSGEGRAPAAGPRIVLSRSCCALALQLLGLGRMEHALRRVQGSRGTGAGAAQARGSRAHHTVGMCVCACVWSGFSVCASMWASVYMCVLRLSDVYGSAWIWEWLDVCISECV